jgi:hypothetical protein
MYTGFCIHSILWKQKEENINVHVYCVLNFQNVLETEGRKHKCTCILGSVFYIYVFYLLFPEHSENSEPSIHVHLCFLLFASENTKNTEPSIHVHLCFLVSVSREN